MGGYSCRIGYQALNQEQVLVGEIKSFTRSSLLIYPADTGGACLPFYFHVSSPNIHHWKVLWLMGKC